MEAWTESTWWRLWLRLISDERQGSKNKIKLNAEYRLYSSGIGGGMLKQGWMAYEFDKSNELQVGLTQVPFGITQYNSHNWFFSLNYYVGLEDDHDMGIKFQHQGEKWDYAFAFFKNAEELTFGSYSDVSNSRYSYDVASIDLDGDGIMYLRNKEIKQIQNLFTSLETITQSIRLVYQVNMVDCITWMPKV